MRIGVLFRTEMIKVRRRPAFWVAVLALLAALALTYGIRLHASVKHGRTPAPLPEAWEGILLGTGPLPALLAAVALILLTASEFSWRTARQNVIDGLSKNEWFLAKLLLLPFLATVFLGVQIVAGAGAVVALAGAGEGGAWIGREDLGALAGSSIAFLGIGSMALLAAFAARSSGPAIGIFLLYLAIAEDVLLLVMRRIESIAAAADFLPGRLMVTLLRGEQYYAEAARRVIEAAQEAGRTPPTIHDTGTLLLAASSYALLFLAAAFVLYSRRDL